MSICIDRRGGGQSYGSASRRRGKDEDEAGDDVEDD